MAADWEAEAQGRRAAYATGQSRLIEVDVEVVTLDELRAGTVTVAGGRLERIVSIDRRRGGSALVRVLKHDGSVDVQVYGGGGSTPFLVLREAAV